jgi:HlyD family secretion protein
MKKLLVLLVLLAACRAGATVERTEIVRVEAAHKGKIEERVLLTGELHAANAIELQVPRTEMWQQTIKWMADDGAPVKAGERLLEFDTSSAAKQIEEKKLALADAEMAFDSARALSRIDLEGKDVELRQHQLALEKASVHADVPSDLLSVREAQDRQLAKKQAQVAVEKAKQDVAAQKEEAALDLKVKQIDVDKARRAIDATEKSLADLVLTAPRDGTVVVEEHMWEGRKYHVGDNVWPGMRIVSLPDPAGGMEVLAELSDVDDGKVAVGETGTCTLDAYPGDALACKVERLTPVARSRNGRGSLRRAFEVVLSLPKSNDRMRSGMSVKVELRRKPVDGAVVVPRGAVVDGKRVRLESGELRDVTVGACDAEACAIDKGISEGEKVRL